MMLPFYVNLDLIALEGILFDKIPRETCIQPVKGTEFLEITCIKDKIDEV